jgi:hypothetical protein
MGQRHQVYVFVTDKNNGNVRAYAYHNQWCYGTLPLRHLARIVKFQKKAQEYNDIGGSCHDDETDKIAAILALDIEEASYGHYFSIINEVTEKDTDGCIDFNTVDPSRGDNNDGITVIRIDGKTKKVQYCFMNVGEGDGTILAAPKGKPLSAKEYVSLYYKEGSEKWKGLDVAKWLKAIGKTTVLTRAQCKRLLPKFYTKALVEA